MLQINGVLLISEGEILKSFRSFDVMPSSVIPERTTDLKTKRKKTKVIFLQNHVTSRLQDGNH